MRPPKPPRQVFLGLPVGWLETLTGMEQAYRRVEDPALRDALRELRADLERHREQLAWLAGVPSPQGRLGLGERETADQDAVA